MSVSSAARRLHHAHGRGRWPSIRSSDLRAPHRRGAGSASCTTAEGFHLGSAEGARQAQPRLGCNGSASHLATVLRNWRARSITAHRSLAPSSRPHTLGGRTSSPLPPTSSASNDLSAPASIGRPSIAAHNNKIAVVLISCVTARTLNAAYHTVKLPHLLMQCKAGCCGCMAFALAFEGFRDYGRALRNRWLCIHFIHSRNSP